MISLFNLSFQLRCEDFGSFFVMWKKAIHDLIQHRCQNIDNFHFLLITKSLLSRCFQNWLQIFLFAPNFNFDLIISKRCSKYHPLLCQLMN